MAVNLSPIWGAGAQLFDNSGNVLSGGKIYTYAAGTTTPATTYTSSNGITANSNPIILNSAGRVPYEIWLTDTLAYKFVLKDSNDTLIATYDNLVGINSNYIAYTAQQEIQTATAGQTIFDLATMQYQPGTNNLSVFVDGVNQYGPGAQYAYVETDTDTVTFVSGLHVGASVKFTTASPVAGAVMNAENVAYDPPFTGAVGTNVEAKLAQTVSVKDFGAVGDGSTDDTAAIQDALDYAHSIGGAVVTADGTCRVSSEVLVESGVTFNFNKLIPDTASNRVMRIYGGCIISGTIDTSEFPAYSSNALTIDGNGENMGSPFRLHIKTAVNVVINGGGSTGTAVYFQATDTNARIMGVQLNLRVNNFYYGIYMSQTSTDLSRFITSNYISMESSDTLRALWMESAQANHYGIDGNVITAKGQPKSGTTHQLYKLCGQDNTFDLLPWDWDTVVGTAPVATTLDQYSRRNIFYWHTEWSYFSNASTDASNVFFAPFNSGIRCQSLAASRVDNLLPFLNCEPSLANNKYYLTVDNTGGRVNLIGMDASNNVLFTCKNVYGFGINGTQRLFITPTYIAPNPDNAMSCGSGGARWTVVYAATGTINTSDGTTKQQIRELSNAEKAVANRCKSLIRSFKFNDAVETKADGARWHFGVIAQDVKDAFEAEGLVAEDYGVFCSDTLEDGSVRLGVRYDELFAFIIGAM